MEEILSNPNAGQIWGSLKYDNRNLTKKLVQSNNIGNIIGFLENNSVPDLNLKDSDMNGMTALMYQGSRYSRKYEGSSDLQISS